MPAFSDVLARAERKPARVIELPPASFVDTWPDKPKASLAIGIRCLSVGDLETARGEAAKASQDDDMDLDSKVEAYNDALLRWAVACGTCHPSDATEAMWPLAHEVVRDGLTPEAARRLFDEISALHVSESPLTRQATDDELQLLGAITLVAVKTLPPGRARRVRRLLGFVLDELGVNVTPAV